MGMFDGVHLGHQAVVELALHSARRSRGIAGVLTFHPHPSRLLRPDQPTLLIMDVATKTQVMHGLGIDLVIQKKFGTAFADLSAEGFVQLLQTKLPGLAALYVGENFRFGKGRTGDVNFLVKAAGALGIAVFSAPPIKYNGQVISSTRIREALLKGDIEKANALLGRNYSSWGKVVPGRQLGRKLGFPTFNFSWQPELQPCYGVYTVRLAAKGTDPARGKRGVANYGVRPTTEGSATEPLLEVHLLEDGSDYGVGEDCVVEWHTFLRAERTFSSKEMLREQIARDKSAAQAYWGLKA